MEVQQLDVQDGDAAGQVAARGNAKQSVERCCAQGGCTPRKVLRSKGGKGEGMQPARSQPQRLVMASRKMRHD